MDNKVNSFLYWLQGMIDSGVENLGKTQIRMINDKLNNLNFSTFNIIDINSESVNSITNLKDEETINKDTSENSITTNTISIIDEEIKDLIKNDIEVFEKLDSEFDSIEEETMLTFNGELTDSEIENILNNPTL